MVQRVYSRLREILTLYVAVLVDLVNLCRAFADRHSLRFTSSLEHVCNAYVKISKAPPVPSLGSSPYFSIFFFISIIEKVAPLSSITGMVVVNFFYSAASPIRKSALRLG